MPYCCRFCSKWSDSLLPDAKGLPLFHYPCSSCKADGNPVPPWQTRFAAQLKPSYGVYFICADKDYLSPPPFWSGTCSLGYVTPHIDLAWSNISLPLPVYTNQRIRHVVILSPLSLALGLTAGLTGAMGGTSSHKFQPLSTDTAVSIEKTARTLQRLQSQLDSLAATVLQNHRALDLLTAGQGGTCLYLKEECCFYYNQSGQVQEDIKGLLEQATKIRDLNSTSVWSSLSFPSWLLPFMGPVITILLGLLFGPCILQLLTKFISSRLQQFQTKLLLLQGWKLVSDVEHPNLDQVERDFCSARQAYAHAQQEEVTEERDLCPNSQEVS